MHGITLGLCCTTMKARKDKLQTLRLAPLELNFVNALALQEGRTPSDVIRRAIKGMLQHNRLGAQQIRKLKVYAGSDHPHQAQRPEPLA